LRLKGDAKAHLVLEHRRARGRDAFEYWVFHRQCRDELRAREALDAALIDARPTYEWPGAMSAA
jgi:hypothetical protein